MEHSINYGQTNIKFKVNRKKRKTLGINVLPSGDVTVDAPEDAPLEKVKELLGKRANWILKQKREIASFHPPMPPKQYLTGETFRFLGNQYRLNIIEADKSKVQLTRDRIEVYTIVGNETKSVEKCLKKWFREEARKIFNERLLFCMNRVEKIGIKSLPTIKLRKMEKRWGSCTNDGLIILNPELVSAPIDCIDYVIIHELCHLKELSHNRRFYQLLSIALPNWENLKEKLNNLDYFYKDL